MHLACAGNQVVYAERTTTDWRLLRGGERLLPGEVVLDEGESYASPWLVGTWGAGLDQASTRLHDMLRARPQHPRRPRPVLLNTWEATYYDHDLDHLLDLADRAASVGVERFVLDDGWFGRRRDDTRGLGDWVVSQEVWPDGLGPLVEHVNELGMEFGLWVEPEMVSLDSELAERHPEWLLQTARGPGIPSRQQHVLDLAHPGAYAHVRDQISALVDEYDIAYLKWDHNRPLVDAGHWPSGRPGVHEQARAALALMAELKGRHPGLEIESCAGGGGRIDLATAEVVDRFWPSDCIDAHERHRINAATGLLVPPELLGTHIGSGRDHTTGRWLDLDFRAGTALWGHLGIEWDLSSADEAELDRLRDWVALHKAHRDLLHSGVVVHADPTNPALQLDGVVARDGREALYKLSMLEHSLVWPPGRVVLPGLDPATTYLVTIASPRPLPGSGWLRHGPATACGSPGSHWQPSAFRPRSCGSTRSPSSTPPPSTPERPCTALEPAARPQPRRTPWPHQDRPRSWWPCRPTTSALVVDLSANALPSVVHWGARARGPATPPTCAAVVDSGVALNGAQRHRRAAAARRPPRTAPRVGRPARAPGLT